MSANLNMDQLSTLLAELRPAWQRLVGGQLSLIREPGPSQYGSTVSAPITHAGVTYGWLQAESSLEKLDQARPLLESWTNLLSQIADERQTSQGLTNELMVAWDRLSLLHQVTQLMRTTADPWQLALEALRMAAETIEVENAFVAHQIDQTLDIRWLHPAYGEEETRCIIAGLQRDEGIMTCHSVRACQDTLPDLAGLHSFMGQQLAVTSAPPSFIGLTNQTTRKRFNAGDLQLFESLAEQITTAIDIQALHMQQIEAKQLARDLEIAAEIQANLLPVGLPELPGYQVAASLISASKIGGDFYDFCQVDGQAGSLVCDVAGKGVSAALLAAEVRSAIRSEFQHNREPGKVLRSANDRLYEDMKRVERFATIVLMCLSVDGQSCHYASAGHTTAFQIQADPLRVQALPSTTVPLGVLPEIEDISTRLDLQPNDVVVIYSDGLIEVENEQGKILGMDGLIDVLLATHLAPAQFILESLIETNTRHRGNAPVSDDLTLLVMKKVADNTPTAHYLARLSWQSEASVLPEVEAELDRLRPYLPIADDTGTWLMQVQLAVTEVVSNIIRHSYAQRTGDIHGLVALYPDRLQIELFDRGEAYAPRDIPSLDFGPTKPPESGYGLPILHRVMDTVVYERLSDGYNHWRLARSLPGATSS